MFLGLGKEEVAIVYLWIRFEAVIQNEKGSKGNFCSDKKNARHGDFDISTSFQNL